MLDGPRKIIAEILDDGLREHLHKLFEAREKGEKYEIPKNGIVLASEVPATPVILPPGVIYAELTNETAKAVNLKVYLDVNEYSFSFPFNKPSLQVWMPKVTVQKVDSNHWKILVPKMWAENLDKQFLNLKSYIIKNYGYNWGDLNKQMYKVVLLKK